MVELHSCSASIRLITWRHTISTIWNNTHPSQSHSQGTRNPVNLSSATEDCSPASRRSSCLTTGDQRDFHSPPKPGTRNRLCKEPEASSLRAQGWPTCRAPWFPLEDQWAASAASSAPFRVNLFLHLDPSSTHRSVSQGVAQYTPDLPRRS